MKNVFRYIWAISNVWRAVKVGGLSSGIKKFFFVFLSQILALSLRPQISNLNSLLLD